MYLFAGLFRISILGNSQATLSTLCVYAEVLFIS
jgi:hypothetical protein